MNSIENCKTGDLVWLDARLDREVLNKLCQKPRVMPGDRAGLSPIQHGGARPHCVILLEKDFSIQKVFHTVDDFDVKVLSPVLGTFWIPHSYLLTLEEYYESLKPKNNKKTKKRVQ